MGRPIGTTLRTRSQFEKIVAANPFDDAPATRKFLCVTFLSEPLAARALATLKAIDFGDEEYHVSGRQIYTWYPHGQARSELAEALGKLPQKGTLTTRNWNTVLKLLDLLSRD